MLDTIRFKLIVIQNNQSTSLGLHVHLLHSCDPSFNRKAVCSKIYLLQNKVFYSRICKIKFLARKASNLVYTCIDVSSKWVLNAFIINILGFVVHFFQVGFNTVQCEDNR
ncbi:hypothetical protein CHS0354_038953 [Potamilus streckersoni]|uniref:Uncharacterized protein n=1 Tax=Potamilus streckersoni TaxID=2493646 RepID=A0AAE0S0Y7_9BIVA|nr:hypothetical protein CHS0354_038953 [Potamilus streckersoni]